MDDSTELRVAAKMEITSFVASRRNNALLVGDHNAYRTQLSRRIRTVRKKLGRATQKGKKFATKSTVTAEEISSNVEFVHLILLTSERAWAHAMHMRASHSADNSTTGISGSTRKHVISRLHKAELAAVELVKVLSDQSVSGATDIDLLEARAYASSLAGAVEFERRRWDQCLTAYSIPHMIYQALGAATKKDVFKEFQASAIDPNIRYAAYMRRMPRTLAIPTIARKYFPADETKLKGAIEELDPSALAEESSRSTRDSGPLGGQPRTITWRSRTVSIEDTSISSDLAAVEEASIKLKAFLESPEAKSMPPKEKAAAYDDVLIAIQDAADDTKHAIDELVAEGVGQGDKRMQALQVTKTAVNYALVGWRVGRNRVLVGEGDGAISQDLERLQSKSKRKGHGQNIKAEGNGRKLAKLREQAVLYDATLQSLDSVKELPGVAADEPFLRELEGTRSYFQALKCFILARSHTILTHLPNALSLLFRALTLVTHAQDILPDSPHTDLPLQLAISSSNLSDLHALLTRNVSTHRALVQIQKLSSSSTQKPTTSKTLISNLNEFPAHPIDLENLVTYPPKLEPVPVKPLFLDVAWNYIQYPGHAVSDVVENGAGDAEAKESADKQTKKGGWFGFGR